MQTIRALTDTEKRIAEKNRRRVLGAQRDLKLAQERLAVAVDMWNDLPAAFGHEGARINEKTWELEENG